MIIIESKRKKAAGARANGNSCARQTSQMMPMDGIWASASY